MGKGNIMIMMVMMVMMIISSNEIGHVRGMTRAECEDDCEANDCWKGAFSPPDTQCMLDCIAKKCPGLPPTVKGRAKINSMG
ncbi:PREDICTED: uncharacterized protein LOC109117001 [Tarenaya hassleriana]|uniref:uncharacterized protein LOC109117001 n=1 Tax=Tarenaya hassleriana TaxID=28532 RepID=UPI0008FD5428|nr:PREDICTED: uncharacterized protein LOC109117001 [Tarenaya hassleriana]